MLKRIAEFKPEIIDFFKKEGFALEQKKGTLFFHRGGEEEVVDWRETTGPVSDKFLRTWIENIATKGKLTLLAMGYFSPKAINYYLKNRGLKEKATLIEMGLHNYFEEVLKPSILTHRHDFLLSGLRQIFSRHQLELEEKGCSYCEKPFTALCAKCLSSLCRSHVLICPVCGEYFCHPDIEGKRCFFEHRC